MNYQLINIIMDHESFTLHKFLYPTFRSFMGENKENIKFKLFTFFPYDDFSTPPTPPLAEIS